MKRAGLPLPTDSDDSANARGEFQTLDDQLTRLKERLDDARQRQETIGHELKAHRSKYREALAQAELGQGDKPSRAEVERREAELRELDDLVPALEKALGTLEPKWARARCAVLSWDEFARVDRVKEIEEQLAVLTAEFNSKSDELGKSIPKLREEVYKLGREREELWVKHRLFEFRE